MTIQYTAETLSPAKRSSAWGGVLAMSLGAFVLIASEFMPVSLLTPIAADLGVSHGQAGQAISVSAAFAVITSLCAARFAGSVDRKAMMLGLTILMIASGALITFAPTYPIFMLGRVLIGIAIGGFWSMSAAVIMRLVPEDQVSKALAVLNGGNALATIIAAPTGAFLGGMIGWRWTFFCIVPIGALLLLWQMKSLPSMTARKTAHSVTALGVLNRPNVKLGMLAAACLFFGQFSLFTYIRPFLESATRINADMISAILLALGLMGFIGTTLVGALPPATAPKLLAANPAVLSLIALLLVLFGASLAPTALLLCLWGLIATAAPVGWWTWLAKTLPNDAEAGGGLMVAVIQIAIGSGAAAGGIMYDALGYQTAFTFSAAILLAGAALAIALNRSQSATVSRHA